MDSKPRRLPFTVSSSSSLSPSSFSSSALSAGRLYGRGSVLGSERFSRGAVGKLDSDYQSPRIPGSSRDYSLSESCNSRWKMSMPLSSSSSTPSSSSSTPWTESSYGGRSKPTNVESERGVGSYSTLLGSTQDDESKRAKLSYASRSAYTRTPSTSTPSNTYSNMGGISDSSWSKSSFSPLSRSSSSSWSSDDDLWARRDVEKRTDSGLSGLGEASYRPTPLTSSLYRPERVTSTCAQGARPKESLYSSSRRENSTSSSRRLSSDFVPSSQRQVSDYQPSPRLSRDSTRNSTYEPLSLSSWSLPYFTPLSTRSSSSTYPDPVPNPTSEGGDSDGRSTTRRLLSRLFSRRSSQESSSASGSNSASRSFDSGPEEAPPCEPPLAARERENSETELRSSWLNWNRCNPLFSRRRREGRDESARMDVHSSTHIPLGSPDDGSKSSTQEQEAEEEEEDEEDDEVSVGATAAPPTRASGLSSLLQEATRVPGRSPGITRVMTGPLFRMPQNVIIGMDAAVAGQNQAEAQGKEKPAPSRDPERLRKIQESLLLEDSDEDEGDLCRICQMGETSSLNPLIEPCRCTGSLQYVHQDCIKKWLRSKISSGSTLEAITTCELCKEKLHLNIENFDINELYRSHERSEYEFISCGLYLVVLLHLCEQRFSDVLGAVNEAGFFNLARTLHEHMDNLENSYAESDEDDGQNRPSIDFGDLEDEEEEF
ncbi:E3 ubiquitin-protein ligase MARCH7 [Ictalurus furcatus]|uniref:E3 ubiquitin-protein ligase MARCH7 n=1 Tax=Ictalurus furcatus TaxID=66913 RepID=UPI002350255C|nr:E3 ubiquitin-protein ligase MARCH7 [Ictalurus furcatus]XP_053493928.1 E3 ubiquitin-protein ligase MARCH7 [Ictalurus furcatus]XP_053493929.1 E3 ubiquitin-protein ligase MARCH7 [Ictalurus furcatus]